MAKKLETLVSADGKREWDPETAVQATNLRAQGWQSKAAVEAKTKAEAEAKQAATEVEADKNAAESRTAKSSTTSAK